MSGEITERMDDPSYQGGDSTIYILGLLNPACVWGATKGRGSLSDFRIEGWVLTHKSRSWQLNQHTLHGKH